MCRGRRCSSGHAKTSARDQSCSVKMLPEQWCKQSLTCCQEPPGRQWLSRVALLQVSPMFPGWCDSLSLLLQAEGLTGRASHLGPGQR